MKKYFNVYPQIISHPYDTEAAANERATPDRLSMFSVDHCTGAVEHTPLPRKQGYWLCYVSLDGESGNTTTALWWSKNRAMWFLPPRAHGYVNIVPVRYLGK